MDLGPKKCTKCVRYNQKFAITEFVITEFHCISFFSGIFGPFGSISIAPQVDIKVNIFGKYMCDHQNHWLEKTILIWIKKQGFLYRSLMPSMTSQVHKFILNRRSLETLKVHRNFNLSSFNYICNSIVIVVFQLTKQK